MRHTNVDFERPGYTTSIMHQLLPFWVEDSLEWDFEREERRYA